MKRLYPTLRFIAISASLLVVTCLYTACSDSPEEKKAKRSRDPAYIQLLAQIDTEESNLKNNGPNMTKKELKEENLKLEQLKTQKDFFMSEGEINPSHGYVKVAVGTTLKKIMNDPDSLKDLTCTNAKGIGKAWEVDCTYRGTNSFGGVVANTTTFLIFKNYLAVPVD